MGFTQKQTEKLSDLFMDLASALFISVIALPAISDNVTSSETVRAIAGGLIFVYLSLKIVEEGKK